MLRVSTTIHGSFISLVSPNSKSKCLTYFYCRIDYCGTESGAKLTLYNQSIRKDNMSKHVGKNVNFINTDDNTKMLSGGKVSL